MTTNNSRSIASLLQEARALLDNTTDSPRLDAELLLAHCLNKDRTYLFTWPEASVPDDIADRFRQLVKQRATEVPLAYLTGSKEFWSLDFTVTPDTLIPRADTELLVQLALDTLRQTPGPVLDLGTGSGAIAISIASELPDIPVDAVDNNPDTIKVAQLNARRHGTEVRFFCSDWFQQLTRTDYQLIVSNPPYIAHDDAHLTRGGLQHEPTAALRAADHGMADIRHITGNANRHSRDGGWLMIEHGYQQGMATRHCMQQHGLVNVSTRQDLANRDRVTIGQISQQ